MNLALRITVVAAMLSLACGAMGAERAGGSALAKNGDNTGTLTMRFKGPFRYGQCLRADHGKNQPVTVRKVTFAEKELGNYLLIEFTFNGKKDRDRKISLNVALLDASRNCLASRRETCCDARLSPPKTSNGTEPDVPFLINSHTVPLDKISPQQISELEVSFSDAGAEVATAISGPDGGVSLMHMVNPRIIIQEEEEEKLGVVPQP